MRRWRRRPTRPANPAEAERLREKGAVKEAGDHLKTFPGCFSGTAMETKIEGLAKKFAQTPVGKRNPALPAPKAPAGNSEAKKEPTKAPEKPAPPRPPASMDKDFHIIGLTLIDAKTGKPVPGFDPIPDGAEINLSSIAARGGRAFPIR